MDKNLPTLANFWPCYVIVISPCSNVHREGHMLYLDICVNVSGNQAPICFGHIGMLVTCSGYGMQGYLCMLPIEVTIKGSTFYSETIGYHAPHCTRFVPHLPYSQPWFFIHCPCFHKYQFHRIPLCLVNVFNLCFCYN